MRLYAIRGATTASSNGREEILAATRELLEKLVAANNIRQEDVVSIIFTTTSDLTAEFPAKACRLMGWTDTALLGAVEANVPHGIPRCIRVLIHAYREEGCKIKHVYLHEAVTLRPDLAERGS